MFDVPFVRTAWCGTSQTSIFPCDSSLLRPVRFIRVLCAIRGKDAIVVLTTDSTDFTDKIAGRASMHLCYAGRTWRCPVRTCRAIYFSGNSFMNRSLFRKALNSGSCMWSNGSAFGPFWNSFNTSRQRVSAASIWASSGLSAFARRLYR